MMRTQKSKNMRLIGVFLLGFLLTNFPIISLFNRDVLVCGYPLLYLYLYTVWVSLIFLIFVITRKKSSAPPKKQPPDDA